MCKNARFTSVAATLPFSVIREANPPQYSGTATGVINFLNFTFRALLGPVFARILVKISGPAYAMKLSHCQSALLSLLFGVAIAIIFTFLLRETGTSVCKS